MILCTKSFRSSVQEAPGFDPLLKKSSGFDPLYKKLKDFNWGKNMHTFYHLGGKYAFSLLFSSPFNHFFSPTYNLAIFLPPPPPWGGGVKQKNIHP